MGGGAYSSSDRSTRAETSGFATKSTSEIFTQRTINSSMNPYGINLRESRDSEEHPNSLAIVLGLDVTGSMGSVPHYLVKEALPDIVDKIIKSGQKDPQLLFMGIGDHAYDSFPLQVGQFESSDELLDKWLTDIYLEGGGGGNDGESYHLAWYFADKHTEIDCYEKRKQKGFLFTVGDEPVLKDLSRSSLKNIMGDGQYSDESIHDLLNRVQKKYNVYHLHIKQTASGSRQKVIDGWRQILSDNLIVVEKYQDISSIISDVIKQNTHDANMNKSNSDEAVGLKEEIML